MTDTKKLDIRRKVCKVFTWSICERTIEGLQNKTFYGAFDPLGRQIGGWCSEISIALQSLPNLESDNGKAMAALVKLCEETGQYYEVRSNAHGLPHLCLIKNPRFSTRRYKGIGATPSEAIVKAIIASAEGQK